MIVLAIFVTLVAVVGSLFILYANAMGQGSSPNHPFVGGFALFLIWGLSLTLWLAWWVG